MRQILSDNAGRLVLGSGRITEALRQSDGTYHLCFNSVEIRPLHSDRAMQQVPATSVSHLWVNSIDRSMFQSIEMLTLVDFVGTPYAYSRRDGSTDWSIRCCAHLNLTSALETIHRIACGDLDRQHGGVRRLLEQIDTHHDPLEPLAQEPLALWDWLCDPQDLLKTMRQAHRNYEESQARFLKASLAAPKRGRCRKPQLIHQLRKVGGLRAQAAGFA